MQTRIERLIFFEDIYNKLLFEYVSILSVSRIASPVRYRSGQDVIKKQVKIVDSATISLFKDIFSVVLEESQKTVKEKARLKFIR